MKRILPLSIALVAITLAMSSSSAGQAPSAASDPDVPVSHADRVYAAEQFSNTVSVTNPADNRLLGVIRLGDPAPAYLSPLYTGQLLVHGIGFSPDHRTLAVVSIGSNSVTFIDTATNAVKRVTYVGRSLHEAFFTPDGTQVWLTLKDVGKTMVFGARPPFSVLKTIDTGPITNHVNVVHNAQGMFAYVTVGGLNQVQVFRTDDFTRVATISVGRLPHGVWPSGDGTRVYVGLENEDQLVAIDTLTNTVTAMIPIGQGPQAIVYVPNAVPAGDGTQGLQPLGVAGQVALLSLVPVVSGGPAREAAPTSVALFDQGLLQVLVLQLSAIGLEPHRPYVLALSLQPDGGGVLEPLAAFITNAAGSAIVNALGPIRQIVRGEAGVQRRYLMIAPGTTSQHGAPVQVRTTAVSK